MRPLSKRHRNLVLLPILAIAFQCAADAAPVEGLIDVETGIVAAGYTDVQVSGRAGTRLSFTDDLTSQPNYFFRLRLGIRIADRHTISALAAPLRIHASGRLPKAVHFDGQDFAEDEHVRGIYRFDSYRLTYRYDFVLTKAWRVGAGVTAKIRDAAILLDGVSKAENRNTGFVPLVNFHAAWRFADAWTLILDFDALAAPQGRAEDVLLAFQVRIAEPLELRFGYRILEGGADNDNVYTFTLFHYGSIGLTATF